MKKFIYNIACNIIEKNNCSVVSNEVIDTSVNMMERAYQFYLTSNHEECEEAYIQGVINMAKNFLGENTVKGILNKIKGGNRYE